MTLTTEEVAGWLRAEGKRIYNSLIDQHGDRFASDCARKWHDRAAQVDAMGWRPIEEAPKDGTSILIYSWHGQYVVSWDADELWWYVDDNKHGPYPLRGDVPTHFMPLPQPPVTK